jgi:hypothetical protein
MLHYKVCCRFLHHLNHKLYHCDQRRWNENVWNLSTGWFIIQNVCTCIPGLGNSLAYLISFHNAPSASYALAKAHWKSLIKCQPGKTFVPTGTDNKLITPY